MSEQGASASPFQQWLDLCLGAAESTADNAPPGGTDAIAARLQKEARVHFETLSRPPAADASTATPSTPRTASSTVQQDLSHASHATPNGALASLVSALGPAVTSPRWDARGRALFCLLGALEGCNSLTQGVRQAVGQFLAGLCRPERREEEDGKGEGGDVPMDYVDGANLAPEEVTKQLQEMQQQKAAEPSNGTSASFTADDVRDAAVTALAALLRSKLEIFPTQQSPSPASTPRSPLAEALGVVRQSMELRVELATLGVRHRCRGDPSDPANGSSGMWGGGGAGYETGEAEANVADGLSQLPRAKRSMCFHLLDGALDGLEKDESKWRKLRLQIASCADEAENASAPTSLLNSMAAFASLAASCMHGETDPRCLLQLLRLLNKTQRVMMPLFDSNDGDAAGSGGDGARFPSVDVFDAVAPYYPVHFTPPKNDPHGITSAMLQDALMAVLCERGVDCASPPNQSQQSTDQGEEETMVVLAARMFLERLEPPKSSEYDPPSNGSESEVDDKLDAVRDFSSLLLPPSSSKKGAPGSSMSGLNVARLPPSFLSELSSSLARVHEEAVSPDAKSLASAVRKLSSSLAHTLEHATTALWEAFVVDILRHLSPILGTAPQGMHGRASTAYLASLAAEGGITTLNKVLEGCFPRFLGVLSLLDSANNSTEEGANGKSSQQNARDEEKMAAAMRGVAALVSSCRVALQQHERENEGVQVHPHPLSPYISDTIQKVTSVLNEPLGEDEIGPLPLAAVGALESIMTAADLIGLGKEDVASLDKTISLMSSTLFDGNESQCKNIDEWRTACARVLGAVIALGMCQDDSAASNCDAMNAMATSLLPDILASSTSPDSSSSKLDGIRYDWMILSRACANGKAPVSERIVSEIVSRMIVALQSGGTDPKASARALAYLVRHGGPKVGTAFHGLSSGPSDLIQVLCEPPTQLVADSIMDVSGVREKMATNQIGVGLSTLQLPESRAKDEEEALVTIERAYTILPFLIPAYQCPSSASSCGSLVQFVDQVLPPLSKWDGVKLCVAFPLLAAVLENNRAWKADDTATRETLRSMIPFLAQYAVSPDQDVHSRSAAASCLSSILFHSNADEGFNGVQSVKTILQEVVHPAVAASVASLEKELLGDESTPRASARQAKASMESLQSSFQDAIGFLCLLGSISACKGGGYSQTGDLIASFLMELACTGTSQFPFSDTAIQLPTPNEQGKKHPILDPASHAYAIPASAFGSMLSVQNGGPFWRQRVTHKTLPVLLKALKVQAKSQDPPALGILAVVCHMLCCLPASLLGKSNVQQILPTLVAGLVYYAKNLDALARSEQISTKPMEVLSIILAALVKTLNVSPKDVTKFVGIIIPSLLLLCSPSEVSEAYVPKQLLVFQCLETVASHPHARNAVMREKDHVVAVLSAAVDHPSIIVRNAVVQVRNVWCTLA